MDYEKQILESLLAILKILQCIIKIQEQIMDEIGKIAEKNIYQPLSDKDAEA